MSQSFFRDTYFGLLARTLSKGKYFPFPEQRPDFVIPSRYSFTGESTPLSHKSDGTPPIGDTSSNPEAVGNVPTKSAEGGHDLEKQLRQPIGVDDVAGKAGTATPPNVKLVDWYGPNDPDNPQNWSFNRKAFVTFQLTTFVVYIGSSLITSSIPYLMEEFEIGENEATVALSLYVFAYGGGAIVFSPLSEIPKLGRNTFYIPPFILFVLLQIGTCTVSSWPGLCVLRLLTGALGSPLLATGGASIVDLWPLPEVPMYLSVWVLFAYAGPALGPVIGNYAAEAMGWRWPMWELLWMAAAVLILIFFYLPETSGPHILYHRARRLRRLTGNKSLRAQSEIDQGKIQISEVVINALVRPAQMFWQDPAVLFADLYVTLVYAIYYLFFITYPIVFTQEYHFSWGNQGLPYFSIICGGAIFCAVYILYQKYTVIPGYVKEGWPVNEKRLNLALITVFLPPIGLFIFAWSARSDVHWIGCLIGTAIYTGANFITLQCLFFYIILTYPQYSASLLAFNDFMRSAGAAGVLHAGGPMFRSMHIDGGVSFLAGLTILGIPGLWAIWYWGAKLRTMSRFALSDK